MATSIPQLLFSYLHFYQHTTATIQLPAWLPAYHCYYSATCMATSISPQLLFSYLHGYQHTTATIQLPACHSYYSATCIATSITQLLFSYLHGYQHTTATIQLPAWLPACWSPVTSRVTEPSPPAFLVESFSQTEIITQIIAKNP